MAGSYYNTIFASGGNSTTGTVGNMTFASGAVLTATNAVIQAGNMTFADGSVITAGTTNGLMFGGNTNQKIGEYGITAVIQPAGTGELLGLSGNSATAANATNMNSNGNTGNTAYTFNDLVKALKTQGLVKQ